MAQKINPTLFRLGLKKNWWTIQPPTKNLGSFLHMDTLIRKVIYGCFYAHNILVSNISIQRYPRGILLSFLVHPNLVRRFIRPEVQSSKPDITGINKSKPSYEYIITFIKSLLEKVYNIPFKFQVRESTKISNNAKLMAEWIAQELQKNPRQHRSIMRRALKTVNIK